MEGQITLVYRTGTMFQIKIQDQTGFGVIRNYQLIDNIPGKKYRGGNFNFLNPPSYLQFGHYEKLCGDLQQYVIENLEKIRNIPSRNICIFLKL